MNGRRRQEILSAARRYAAYHGKEAREVEVMSEVLPETYFYLGEITGIDYQVIEGGREVLYHHDFEKPAALAISFDGKTALLPGGAWRFTDRGFEG